MAVTPPGVPGSDIDLDGFYADLDRLLARRETFATVQDLSGASPLDPKRRKRFAQFLAERAEVIKHYLVCNAIVVDSALTRGFVTAILWVTPSPVPYKVFATRADAIAWCKTMYDQATAADPP